MKKIVYFNLLADLVDNDVISEWQAGFLSGLYSVGSQDYSYYKLSKFIYSNLHYDRVGNYD